MALFYSREQLWDKSLGGNDTSDEIPHGWGRFFSGLFGFLCKILFRYRIDNQEVLRAFEGKKRGAVVVAPHVSYLDVVIIFLSARPRQWIRLLGRDSLFDIAGGLFGQILSRVGAIPVKRDSADRTAIKRATRILKNGELLGVFPEGTRRGKGDKIPSLHGGAALMARMGKAPLIPLGLTNIDLVKQKGKFFRFPKITATFGDPIEVSSFDFLAKEERLEGCVWYVMRESFALSRGVSAEEVDMTALFPDSKDYTGVFRENPISPMSLDALEDYVVESEK